MSSVAAAGVAAPTQSLVSGADKALDKTAFLKLLVAQMKNQDPLKPLENSEFVAQLAQFSNLEQVMGINSRLDALTMQGQGQSNTEIASLVGKHVQVNGSTVGLDGSGAGVPISFSLGATSDVTRVTITDLNGKTVRTMDVGPKVAGLSKISWDGKNEAGIAQPAGGYKVAVDAKNSAGAPVTVTQDSTGVVSAVSFSKGYPELQLDNGLSVPVSDLLRVEASATTTTTP